MTTNLYNPPLQTYIYMGLDHREDRNQVGFEKNINLGHYQSASCSKRIRFSWFPNSDFLTKQIEFSFVVFYLLLLPYNKSGNKKADINAIDAEKILYIVMLQN